MEFVTSSGGDWPPEVREMIEGFGAEDMLAGVAVYFVLYLIAGVIFATLGGMFGALIFRTSPQGPPSAPPPMSVPPVPPMPSPPSAPET